MSGSNKCHEGLYSRVVGTGCGGGWGCCFLRGDENSGGIRGKGLEAKCLPSAYVED